MRRIGRTDLSRVARPREFALHMVTVALTGTIALGAVVGHIVAQGDPLVPHHPGVWILLVLVVVDGIAIGCTRRGLYIPGAMPSAALTFGLLLVHGWVVAALWQCLAVVICSWLRRDSPPRLLYSLGHYVLAFLAADLVLRLFGCRPERAEPYHIHVGDLPAIGCAAVAWMIVSQSTGWFLRAAWLGVRTWTLARQEFSSRLVSHGALLGLGPLVAIVTQSAPWFLPLFVVPLYSLYRATMVTFDRERESRHDALTGLPNRRMLMEYGDDALGIASARAGHVALVLLDLHRFHEVNDTLGHHSGDRLLQQVGRRLGRIVRPGDLVARLGGDEFAVLLPLPEQACPPGPPDVAAADRALGLARQIVEVLGEPFQVDDLMLDIEASAGVALFPSHARDVPGLLQYADVAMYLAKRTRSGVELYDPSRDVNTREKLLLLGDLRRALDDARVELHYQPKQSFAGDVVGCEALVRWTDPERGPVPPDEFVQLAEQTGLMPRLTRYVVDEALAQVARWRRAGIHVPVAVNVSARDILAPAFADTIAAGLLRHDVPPAALQLEITERVLLDEPQKAADGLDALRRLGVCLSLDDFGTGYSSLVHLRHIPVSEIKIDRSFVARLAHDEEDQAIVRSTVELAHSLGLTVVAEGVEDDETWERLRALGCDAAQGWLVSKAMPRDKATAWLLGRGPGGITVPGPAMSGLAVPGPVVPKPAGPGAAESAGGPVRHRGAGRA